LLTSGVSRVFVIVGGKTEELKADGGGRALLGGTSTPSPPARRSGSALRGSEQSPNHPEVVSNYFQHSGWPLLAL